MLVYKLQRVRRPWIEGSCNHLQIEELLVHCGPAVRTHPPQLRPARIVASNEVPVTQRLPTELHPLWV